MRGSGRTSGGERSRPEHDFDGTLQSVTRATVPAAAKMPTAPGAPAERLISAEEFSKR